MLFKRKFIAIISLCIVIVIFVISSEPKFGMSLTTWRMLALVFIMVILWLSEIIPIGITSLIPIVYAPIFGLDSIANITINYSNPVVFLFLGGFVLGLSIEKWNLHKRISLLLLSKIGNNPKKQLLAFMVITAFFSMWINNTSTTIMMLPIALAIIVMLKDNEKNLGKAILISIAYSSSIGGIGTLIGTAPNLLLRAYLESAFNIKISFLNWMLLAIPIVVVLMICTYIILVYVFKLNNIESNNTNINFKEQLKAIGKITKAEKLVLLIFILTALSWIFRDYINSIFNIKLTDDIIAILSLLALFLTPLSLKNKQFIMDFDDIKRIPWDILLLFGGGLALSSLFIKTGFSTWVSGNLGFIQTLSVLSVMFIVTILISYLTELTSNTAIVATFLPLMGSLAINYGFNPVMLTIPLAIIASCAFMMPVATPPNAIIFGSKIIVMKDLIKSGFILNILAIITITIISYLLIPILF